MKKLMLIISASIACSGCATVDPNLQLAKSTKLLIVDKTTDVLYSTGVATDSNVVNGIARRIISDTKDKLSEYGIDGAGGDASSAMLKYEIKTISGYYNVTGSGFLVFGRNKIEIKYRATLESPDGKKLFVYDDEQDESNIDEVCEDIGHKVAKRVARYYRQGN